MNKADKILIFQLRELKRQIDNTDNKDKGPYSSGWYKLFNAILKKLKESDDPIIKNAMENEEDIVWELYSLGPQKAVEVTLRTHNILCNIDSDFFKTEEKKAIAETYQAEAMRRKAVADFKEQGRKIEIVDASRKRKKI